MNPGHKIPGYNLAWAALTPSMIRAVSNLVRKRLNIKTDLMQTIMKRKLGLFGHICRMENSRKIKSVMLGIMEGKGRRGRPNMQWIDNIKEWCNKDLYSLPIQLAYICTRPKTLETND